MIHVVRTGLALLLTLAGIAAAAPPPFTGQVVAVTDGRLRGDEIAFTSGGSRYTGRVVTGNRMEGTVTTRGATTKWAATR